MIYFEDNLEFTMLVAGAATSASRRRRTRRRGLIHSALSADVNMLDNISRRRKTRRGC